MRELSDMERFIDRMVKPVSIPVQGSDWAPCATHEGVINIGDHRLRVYRLNTGERIINADDLKDWINSVPMEEVTDGDSEFRRLVRVITGGDK